MESCAFLVWGYHVGISENYYYNGSTLHGFETDKLTILWSIINNTVGTGLRYT